MQDDVRGRWSDRKLREGAGSQNWLDTVDVRLIICLGNLVHRVSAGEGYTLFTIVGAEASVVHLSAGVFVVGSLLLPYYLVHNRRWRGLRTAISCRVKER